MLTKTSYLCTSKYLLTIMTRLKDILNERNITLKEFAATLNITYTALYYQLDKPSYSTLVKWASVLNVPVWQLFASPDEIAAHQADNNELCAFVRYRTSNNNVIHLYADTWEQFWGIVDEIASTHPRPRNQP